MWKRRLITIPLTIVAAQLSFFLLPITFVLGGLIDLFRGGKSSVTRTFAFLTFLLWSEVFGLFAAFVVWVVHASSMYTATDWFRVSNHKLQRVWALALWRFALFVYNIDVEIEVEVDPDADIDVEPADGPSLFLIRHVSTFDTLLPFIVTESRVFRYVLKSELLWDPCLDVVGHRVPNVFVQRGQADTEKQVQRLLGLTVGMKNDDAVVIFPEGTRFTESKRDRIRDKAAASADPLFMEAATSLCNTLPPTRAGAVALMQSTDFKNVTIIAHAGAEGAVSLANLFSGALRDIVFRVKVWNFPHEVQDEETTRRWLVERWKAVDRFVGENQ